MSNRKPNRTRRELRALRIQQLVFVAVGILVIFRW